MLHSHNRMLVTGVEISEMSQEFPADEEAFGAN